MGEANHSGGGCKRAGSGGKMPAMTACPAPPDVPVMGGQARRRVLERKLLQITMAIVGLVAILFGVTGVFFGTSLSGVQLGVTMEGYVRFIKGVLIAAGLIYWSAIPQVEKRGERIGVVTFILVFGAIGRLLAVVGHGFPTVGLMVSLVGELIVVPAIWLWHRRFARHGAAA
jgi:hypothetical protein